MKEKEIKVLIEEFDRWIYRLPANRRKQVEKLIEKIGTRFFTAPASGADSKHDAEPGGLLNHSLEVQKNLWKLRNLWFPNIPDASVIIAGLFHDLGKMGQFDGPDMYIPAKEDWQIRKGIRYQHNKELTDGLSHAQRSVRILNLCNVELNDEEYIAILYHDGLYMDENILMAKAYFHPLMMALHWADYYTAFFDTERK